MFVFFNYSKFVKKRKEHSKIFKYIYISQFECKRI